ncbi:MAG: chromate efflux transporter [Parvibaculum sp.]
MVAPNTQASAADQIPFRAAFLFWLKLGFISFGGPAGQISIMHDEVVERRRWVSERRFLHALNYCMVLPGPEAQQLATYIGWLMHGVWGGIIAGTLFVLPSLFILIGLSWVYIAFGDVSWVAGLLYGIKPAVTAIVAQAAYRIGLRTLKNTWTWGIAISAFVAIFALGLPFPLIVMCAALTGFVGGRLAPAAFQSTGGHASKIGEYRQAVIHDQTVLPHTGFTWMRCARVIGIGFILWLAPMGLFVFYLGWEHILAQMSWFFTKAAFFTFGGAYAVLPYVYQGAVDHFGWLTGPQMIDGLALGETTPGPLIMVVTFVGFVGGYLDGFAGSEFRFLAGAGAALAVTWFTFLPSFIFILAGGPLVEATHDEMKLTAPLSGITAAVVGVIASLALFFAIHVFWPEGVGGRFDVGSLLIALGACIALFRFGTNVIWVILGAAASGLLLSMFPLGA